MIIGGVKRGPVKHSPAAQRHYDKAAAIIKALKSQQRVIMLTESQRQVIVDRFKRCGG